MPNWANNSLYVKGLTSEVKRFKDDAKHVIVYPAVPAKDGWPEEPEREFKSDLSFHKLVNEPGTGTLDTDWYESRLKFWGIKWDVEATCVNAKFINDSKAELYYEFDSAWSPPIKGLEAISKKYPMLRFILIYDEPGMELYGRALIRNGKSIIKELPPPVDEEEWL